MASLAIWYIQLAGCGCDYPTILAGRAEVESRARIVVDQFVAQAAPFSLCKVDLTGPVSARRGVEEDFRVSGTYERVGRTIRVDPDPTGVSMEEVLRHELCHAIDLQNGLSNDHAPWPLDPNTPLLTDIPSHQLTAESFAIWCEMGPDVLALSNRDEAREMVSLAFPHTPHRPVDLLPRELIEWVPPPGEVLSDDVDALETEGGVVQVAVGEPAGPAMLTGIDVATCSEVAPSLEWVSRPVDAENPPGWWVSSHAVTVGDVEVTWGMLQLPDGTQTKPWLAYDGEWHLGEDGLGVHPIHGVAESAGTPRGVVGDRHGLSCFRW